MEADVDFHKEKFKGIGKGKMQTFDEGVWTGAELAVISCIFHLQDLLKTPSIEKSHFGSYEQGLQDALNRIKEYKLETFGREDAVL